MIFSLDTLASFPLLFIRISFLKKASMKNKEIQLFQEIQIFLLKLPYFFYVIHGLFLKKETKTKQAFYKVES